MRILVTGGAGYVGSHTVKLLSQRGHDVWVFDNLSTGHSTAVPRDRLIVADLCETHRLDQVLIERGIEAIVHFAASASVGESMREPAKYWRNNVVHSFDLLECVRRHHIQRFVFSSSAAIFGAPRDMPITEEFAPQPINPYGQTKLAIERALHDYHTAYGLGYAALRYFNAAGAATDGSLGEDHNPETHLIPLAILTALGKRASLEIYGTDYPTVDGTCIRDYVHVEDLAEAHALVLEQLKPGTALHYNLGTGRGYSVREVIQTVEAVSGKTIHVKEAPRRPGDPPVLIASSEKIRVELGWQPRYPKLHEIVETAWRWHRKKSSGLR
ncbi:MAG: UDP-glucose 4-epimerase GalE [Gemmataceae bacterium]|nr:UDP-glucose 4-epimerase GalE [Gemmataceae bacterium]